MAVLEEWTHNVSDIPAGGLHRERKASASECKDLSKALKIPSLGSLLVKYQITALSSGGYRLSGEINADVVQACIVSLETVPSHVSDTFSSEFWPDPAQLESEAEKSILDGADIELLSHGVIDAGKIIFEALSAGLDPYPRKQGAEFDWQDPVALDPTKTSPFAVLAKLKDKG